MHALSSRPAGAHRLKNALLGNSVLEFYVFSGVWGLEVVVMAWGPGGLGSGAARGLRGEA